MKTRENHRRLSLTALAVGLTLGIAASAAAAPQYTIQTIGLTDAEHTRDDGYRYNQILSLSQTGRVSGYAYRYNGGSADLGRSTWLYNGTSTVIIGLTDAEYTRGDGYRASWVHGLNEAGQVSGYSNRYNGGSALLGTNAWFYDGTSTIPLGLTDVEHTRSDGLQNSYVSQSNQAGTVVGISSRYNGGATDLGSTAWLYDGSRTSEIGLIDAEHTRDDGYRSTYVSAMNEAGWVIGNAYRYNGGSADMGLSTWLYNGTSTVNIGLTDAAHTRADGSRWSFAILLNQAGQIAGSSDRLATSGTDAWLYDGGQTIDISLKSVSRPLMGVATSTPSFLNEAGQVAGYAEVLTAGTSQIGQTAWLYNGTSTIDIGLDDVEHTRDQGYRYSDVLGAARK